MKSSQLLYQENAAELSRTFSSLILMKIWRLDVLAKFVIFFQRGYVAIVEVVCKL